MHAGCGVLVSDAVWRVSVVVVTLSLHTRGMGNLMADLLVGHATCFDREGVIVEVILGCIGQRRVMFHSSIFLGVSCFVPYVAMPALCRFLRTTQIHTCPPSALSHSQRRCCRWRAYLHAWATHRCCRTRHRRVVIVARHICSRTFGPLVSLRLRVLLEAGPYQLCEDPLYLSGMSGSRPSRIAMNCLSPRNTVSTCLCLLHI